MRACSWRECKSCLAGTCSLHGSDCWCRGAPDVQRVLQESMQAMAAAIGPARVQKLWVHLLAVEEGSSESEDLAWLALLACW